MTFARSLIGGCVLICIPAVVLTAVTVVLSGFWQTKIVSQRRAAVTRACRTTAVELAHCPDEAEGFEKRGSGWKSSGKIEGVRWGHVERDGCRLVWCGNGETVFTRRVEGVETLEPVDFFYVALAFFLLALVAMTALGLWHFIRSAKAREDFMRATAHDLTTPLAALRLVIGRDDEEARRLNERLLRLVANLKDFLRLGGRTPAPQISDFDLCAAYREAYEIFREDFRDLLDGQDVEVIGGDGPRYVRADETMTVQILWNLLGNALKYAAPYGPVRVSLDEKELPGGARVVRLLVSDEGPGMSAYERRRAFDRYYRARTVLKTGKGGFGIGLCTAREFARAQGGDLTVRANDPHGCVFELTFTPQMPVESPVRTSARRREPSG